MQLTAAVINAGLGDLSLGFRMAGFDVVAAYEEEDNACKIHKLNFETPVYQLPLVKIDAESFPKVDLLAARVHLPSFSNTNRDKIEKYEADIFKLQKIIEHCRPRMLFLLLNTAFFQNDRYYHLLNDAVGAEYQFSWQQIDVSQMTGFPVRENMACAVGILKEIERCFEFPFSGDLQDVPFSTFLEQDKSIDPWYYRIRSDTTQSFDDDNKLFCWKKDTYVSTNLVRWNFMKIPIVQEDNRLRRMTHREIANLKGYPSEYEFVYNDRQWLYKKLIYSGNVVIIQQIAGMLSYTLSTNPWRVQEKERGDHFESLFGCYLQKIKEQVEDNSIVIEHDIHIMKQKIDFLVQYRDNTFYFEVKNSLTPRTKELSSQLAGLHESGTPILAIANEVPDYMKQEYLGKYGIYIWDVQNLLWLFEKFPDIKNEFIAFLEYSPDQIDPQPPIPELFRELSEQKKQAPDLKERLLKIVPGNEMFRDYELTCIEILKYVLGDYLTLWSEQEPSNDGLYRFDLCCKIKSGANQDFFDTIKHYFNTKYIVFEFKNSRERISQKEIYTTEKYLYEKALRKVAIIISRFGAEEHALQAAKGALRENGKLILCLSDNSLLEMIDIKRQGEQEPAEFLSAILDDILVHLEK